jgi:hypothetical protein
MDLVPVLCSLCQDKFEIKNGTLYNIIRRDADGIYCNRKCAGNARASFTQEKYQKDGGKSCKRCGEFKSLENFSKLPNPPYLRSECRRCHNYKPARMFSVYKEKAAREKVPFLVDLDHFIEIWNKKCFYCGANIKNVRIELIDSRKGFVNKNMVSCCRECQKFKSDLEHLDFIEMCQKISNNVKELEER